MRKTYLLTLGIIWAMVHSLAAAKTFEGQYDMAFSGDGEEVTVSFWVKEGHVRMKTGGRGGQMGEMIMRNGMSTIIIIMAQQGMYMEMPIPQDAISNTTKPDGDGQIPFKKTGKSRKILGYTAHEFVFEEGKENMVIWATDEVGSMPFANNPMLQGWTAAMKRMTGLKAFFPLETIGMQGGKEEFRMTVKKIEEKSLPDSMFLPPEGLQKMTLPAGMGGLMPGGK